MKKIKAEESLQAALLECKKYKLYKYVGDFTDSRLFS